ncbi:hypothetical protein ACFQL9_13405 [Halobaculum lipolyticum]|uniref:Nucleoside 2-deoxyribosyltransferase n=1 Tax=Halobaculum lipolyticum TaxID=3032001 RepID=A0ABD5WGE9_9EURY
MSEGPDFSSLYDRYPQWLDDDSDSSTSDLQVHVFGPYRGECEDILKSVTEYLRQEGYEKAAICSEIPNHGKKGSMSRSEKNWWESVSFMNNADVAVFVFLEPTAERINMSHAQGLNSSVIAELVFWSHFFASDKIGTLVLFEGDLYDSMGSLISGVIEANGIESQNVPSQDIDEIKNTVLTNCIQWLWEAQSS